VSYNADWYERHSRIFHDADQNVMVADFRMRPLVSQLSTKNFDAGRYQGAKDVEISKPYQIQQHVVFISIIRQTRLYRIAYIVVFVG